MESATISGRPAAILTMLVTVIVALIAMTIIVSARLPSIGIKAVNYGRASFRDVEVPSAPAFRIAALRGSRSQVGAVRDADMIDPVSLIPDDMQLAGMAKLADAARSRHVTIKAVSGADQRSIIRPVGRVGVHGIAAESWGIIAVTAVCAFIGAWIAAMRPRDWATAMVAISGFALLLAALPVAVSLSVEWIVVPSTLQWCARINTIATIAFGGALIGLFARYPLPVVRWRSLGLVQAAIAIPAIASFAIHDLKAANVPVALYVVGVVLILAALTTIQWRQARRDPLARAYLRWIGAVLLVCASAYAVLMVVPIALGAPPLIGVVSSFALFLPFYLALVGGVVQFRAFELERWSILLLFGAAAALLMIGVDLLLVFALNLAPGRAGLAVVSVAGLCWLLVRDRVRGKVLRAGKASASSLLRCALNVALAETAAARESGWKAALTDLFRPLSIETLGQSDPPRIADDGLTLIVPSFTLQTGFAVRFADRGRRLFSSRDIALVDELLVLIRLVDERRIAYDRGVAAERQRIARDLHDDIGSRLLTGLHRSDHDATRGDIRDALAEMRAIISGLVGSTTPLAPALSVIRRSVAERLEASKIMMEWNSDIEGEACLIGGPALKALESIVREATTNTIRHAHATAVKIDLEIDGAVLRLVYRDDGIGMSGEAMVAGGLRNIHARALEIGGTCDIDNSGDGLAITVMLPTGDPELSAAGRVQTPVGLVS